MIEANVPTNQTVNKTQMTTPTTITTSMILLDLENGIDRPGIKEKYNLEGWELTEMFKHPVLKGKKASRKRRMSFNFIDDTALEAAPETIDLDQVDLEASIEEVEQYNDEQTTAAEQDIASHKYTGEEPTLTASQETALEGEHWENQIKSDTTDETTESFNY